MLTPTVGHLFCGAGGGALGFRRAGFRGAFAIDSSAAACRDFERLVGEPATCADLAALEPSELRALCPETPDMIFTSPPCKAFSGCMPEARAREPKYLALNSLAFRGVWLAMEAWDRPPPLLLLENVPRIQSRSRGRPWLDRICAMLRGYGYAVTESTHDCGVLGGLAQRRRRFLLVARHVPQVEAFLRVPTSRRVRGIGEVLGELPVPLPGSDAGGPMHRLNRLAAINWVRLALIRAGGDWRDIPPAVRLPTRVGRHNGPWGVEPWTEPAHAVLGSTAPRDTWGSVADPRLADGVERHAGTLGLEAWVDPAHTVTGQHGRRNWDSVADPRLGCTPAQTGHLGVGDWEDPARTVRANHRVQNAAASVADPRLAHTEHRGCRGVQAWEASSKTIRAQHNVNNAPASVADPRVRTTRHEGGHGVRGWEQASAAIIAHASIHNFPSQLADPRVECSPRAGTMGVEDWAVPSHAVIGQHVIGKARAAVADPRVPEIVGEPIDLDDKRPGYIVIRAADGTWHRPMTTLELATLQGLPPKLGDSWLELDGNAQSGWRERIGNMVPPPAAEAIATSCLATLVAVAAGRWTLDGNPIWVREQRRRAAELRGEVRP